MPNLNDICRNMTEDIDYAYATAVIDQESGLILGVSHHVEYFTQSYLDAVAAASVELFRGKGITTIEKMMIKRALKLTNNVQSKAAELLGIGKSGFNKKINKYRIY